MRRTVLWTLGLGTAIAGLVALRGTTCRARALRRGRHRLAQGVRYTHGHIKGIQYRLTRRTPDATVGDDVLADRVRSTLGRLEKHLDTPRVHVLVEDHVVLLHGDVPSQTDATAIEHAVQAISGVRGVESYLHVGLRAGSTRPSVGRAQHEAAPSPALRKLLSAATDAGVTAGQERSAIRAVLAMFADRIPDEERAQLFSHVPADVRDLAATPQRYGQRPPRLRTITELVASIATEGGMDTAHAERISEGVLGYLRELVPEEAGDVAAVLPAELRDFWTGAVPS